MSRYGSSSGGPERVSFSEAMLNGLAPDGGLYLPDRIPSMGWTELPAPGAVPALAQAIIEPYVGDDPLAQHLAEITRAVFQIPIHVSELMDGHLVLELFHGPTAAFKDFGAGFLAHCLARAPGRRRLLVATSGDTGGAVAAACHGQPGLEVLILYPEAGVSLCQAQQLTCWGDNVQAFAVRGSFDACQRIVKEALAKNPWPGDALTTANSINIARLVPQVVHHALGSLAAWAKHARAVDFLIPSGNLGNASAALWAKRMGFPINRIVLISNANRVVSDFIESAAYRPRASLSTLANAMDIGDPSNLVRLRALYSNHKELTSELLAVSVSDTEIELAIRDCFRRTGRMLDPHSATAYAALAHVDGGPKLIVSTAHPAKFAEIVEPLLNCSVPIPKSLASLYARPSRSVSIEAKLEALVEALQG